MLKKLPKRPQLEMFKTVLVSFKARNLFPDVPDKSSGLVLQ